MFHDQATIPSKILDWGEAVNVTWGLPFVRTSVDHGVAYDAAATGTASESGMVAAIRAAQRLTGGPGYPVMYAEDFDFEIGKAIEYRKGSDVAFISCGSLLADAAGAADILESKGISTRVVDMHTIKPLDTKMLDQVFAENELVVTVEEHSSVGGLGGAVAEYKAGFADAPRQAIASLGDDYVVYKRQVRMILPLPKGKS